MSPKRVAFHPEARAEFREAIFWYYTRNSLVGVDFRLAVEHAVNTVVAAPRRWPTYYFGTRRYVMDRFPFSVVYLDSPEVINIVAVAHGRRKPGYWRHRV